MNTQDTEAREEQNADARGAYEAPALTDLGSLEELTGTPVPYNPGGTGGGGELGSNFQSA